MKLDFEKTSLVSVRDIYLYDLGVKCTLDDLIDWMLDNTKSLKDFNEFILRGIIESKIENIVDKLNSLKGGD